GGPDDRGQDPERRGFAGAVWTEQPEDRATNHREAEIVDGPNSGTSARTKHFHKVFDPNHDIGHDGLRAPRSANAAHTERAVTRTAKEESAGSRLETTRTRRQNQWRNFTSALVRCQHNRSRGEVVLPGERASCDSRRVRRSVSTRCKPAANPGQNRLGDGGLAVANCGEQPPVRGPQCARTPHAGANPHGVSIRRRDTPYPPAI